MIWFELCNDRVIAPMIRPTPLEAPNPHITPLQLHFEKPPVARKRSQTKPEVPITSSGHKVGSAGRGLGGAGQADVRPQ